MWTTGFQSESDRDFFGWVDTLWCTCTPWFVAIRENGWWFVGTCFDNFGCLILLSLMIDEDLHRDRKHNIRDILSGGAVVM